MGKSASSGPAPPDPRLVSQQQTQSNVNTGVANSYLNNVNQRTPQGSLTYNQVGSANVGGVDVPRWEAVTTYSPEQQRLYDTTMQTGQATADLANRYVGRIGDATAQPFNYDGIPDAPTYNEDYRRQQLQAITDRAAPQMQRDQDALRQRLANQGVTVGTEAWRAAQDDYARAQNDFRLGADVQAGNAAAQQYGLEGSTRDRAISERANLRTQPINEVAALMGTGPGVQSPSFVPTNNYQIAPTDVSGNYWNNYQAQLAQQQMQNQTSNAAMGGLFGLGGTILGGIARNPSAFGIGSAAAGANSLGGLAALGAVSDRRAKTGIRHVGQTFDGQPLYLFRYIDDPAGVPHVGLMADEVEARDPGAVFEVQGVQHVDYDRALSGAIAG